jgi:hypothetical protein
MTDIITLTEDGESFEVGIRELGIAERMRLATLIRSEYPEIASGDFDDIDFDAQFVEFWQNIIPKVASISGQALYGVSMESFVILINACAYRIAGEEIPDDVTNVDTPKRATMGENNTDSRMRRYRSESVDTDDETEDSYAESEYAPDTDFDLNEDGTVNLEDWK